MKTVVFFILVCLFSNALWADRYDSSGNRTVYEGNREITYSRVDGSILRVKGYDGSVQYDYRGKSAVLYPPYRGPYVSRSSSYSNYGNRTCAQQNGYVQKPKVWSSRIR